MYSNMDNKLVSIAMATYNGEKYLEEQLDSIYTQTYNNIEVIVCDDNSSDKTIDILEKYKQQYGLEYYINEKNLGYVKNFEQVISYCRGEYIALCDQDDIWLPNKVETLVKEIGDSLLIHSDAYLMNAQGKVFEESLAKNINKKETQTTIEYFFDNNVTGCTCMFKKELLKYALPIPNGFRVHDYWLAIVASVKGNIKYVSSPLIKYRQHANNQIGAIKKQKTPKQKNICNENRFNLHKTNKLFFDILKEVEIFNIREQKMLENMSLYYDQFFNRNIRIKSFFIYLKYFRFFNRKQPLYRRIKNLIFSLFGCRRK